MTTACTINHEEPTPHRNTCFVREQPRIHREGKCEQFVQHVDVMSMEPLATPTNTHERASSQVGLSNHERVPRPSRTLSCSCRTAAPSRAPYETQTTKGILELSLAGFAGLHPEMMKRTNAWADSTQDGIDREGKEGCSNHFYGRN